MSREYGYIKQFENEILEMKSRGLTQREIADKLGYSNSIVAYKTGTEQNINLVLSTIRAAKKKEKVTAELQLHSDQGFQYTSHRYFKLTQEYNITPSMSRRGNPYDNALAENFFSILKTECIYRVKNKTDTT